MSAHVELVVGLVIAALPLLTILAIVWITRLAGRPSRRMPLRAGAPPLPERARPSWPDAPPRATGRATVSVAPARHPTPDPHDDRP